MTNTSIFDQLEGSTSMLWWDAAMTAVHTVAKSKKLLTTDDIWETLREYPPKEPRALGAVMKSAQKEGIIKPTMTFQTTKRPSRHLAPIRVWESLIYSGSTYRQ